MLQGLILRVLTTGNPDEMRFRQRLDALNYMMADQRMPADVQRKARPTRAVNAFSLIRIASAHAPGLGHAQ